MDSIMDPHTLGPVAICRFLGHDSSLVVGTVDHILLYMASVVLVVYAKLLCLIFLLHSGTARQPSVDETWWGGLEHPLDDRLHYLCMVYGIHPHPRVLRS